MSDTKGASSAPAYTVTGQTEQMKAQPNGAYVDGVTISFVTADQVAGTVWVSVAKYNAANVQAAILARVAVINDVQALGS